MISPSFFSKEILSQAFTSFVRADRNVEKIRRWLWYPHRAERWFQFEFLQAYDKCLPPGYRVAAERKAVTGGIPDLGVYDLSGTDDSLDRIVLTRPPAGVIEMKMIGNWYLVSPTIPDIKRDVAKIEEWMETQPPTPGISLVFAVVAWPTMKDKMYCWLEECVENYGVKTEGKLTARLQNCDRRFQLLVNERCGYDPDQGLEVLDLCLYGCHNKAGLDPDAPPP